MKNKYAFLLSSLCLLFFSPLMAGSVDDSGDRRIQLSVQIERDLKNGNPLEKIRAAQIMGSFRDDRYSQMLAEELLRDLDEPIRGRTSDLDEINPTSPGNNPYIKYQIAWALGNIGNSESLEDLITALKMTMDLVNASMKHAEALRQSAESNHSSRIILNPDRPGPALLRPGHLYQTSPDVFWSVSDDFKTTTTIDMNDPDVQVKLEGYNYVNLTMGILNAIGGIGRRYSRQNILISRSEGNFSNATLDRALEALKPMLDHEIPAVRASAVQAISSIRTLNALLALEERYAKEQDPVVKVRICRSTLIIDKSRSEFYKTLIGYLHSRDREVRLETAMAFRDLGLGESVDDLKRAYASERYIEIRRILEQAIRKATLDAFTPGEYDS